jgi:hypothetical protein
MTDERPAKTVDVEAAKAILDAALRGGVPRAKQAKKATSIEALKPQIRRLRLQKYSWAEIADLLKDTGIGNKDTIRYAMEASKKKKERATAAQPPAKTAARRRKPPQLKPPGDEDHDPGKSQRKPEETDPAKKILSRL